MEWITIVILGDASGKRILEHKSTWDGTPENGQCGEISEKVPEGRLQWYGHVMRRE